MTLLERRHAKELEEERERRNAHPLCAAGLNRNLREAYLAGLVFSASANDDVVVEQELKYLQKAARALRVGEEDLDGLISRVTDLTDDGKWTLFDECVRELSGNVDIQLFCAEFAFVWESGGGRKDECRVLLNRIGTLVGSSLPDGLYSSIDRLIAARQSNVVSLTECEGGYLSEHLQYLLGDVYGDVEKAIELARLRRSEEKELASAVAKEKSERFLAGISGCVKQYINADAVDESTFRLIRSEMDSRGYVGLDVDIVLESMRKSYCQTEYIDLSTARLAPGVLATGVASSLLFGGLAAPIALGAASVIKASKNGQAKFEALQEAKGKWLIVVWSLIALYACTSTKYADAIAVFTGMLRMVDGLKLSPSGDKEWVRNFDRSVQNFFGCKPIAGNRLIYVIDKEKCSRCGACYNACKENAILKDELRHEYLVVSEKCNGCAHCKDVCCARAIKPKRI